MKYLLGLCAIAFLGCGEESGTKVAFGIDERPVNTSCRAPNRPMDTTGVTVEQVFAQLNFQSAVKLLQAPGDPSRWFVVEKRGVVRVFANDDATTAAATFIDIDARVNSNPGEAGLLGMAFHPNWAQNRQVFLSYTGPSNMSNANLRSTISRFTSNDNGMTLDASSEQILLTVEQPYENHNGGNIEFGPDGYLYIGFGDGGSGGDPDGNGQKLDTLLGKMLRIHVDGAAPYESPSSNPFFNGGGRKEIYAWGLRNPWRWSFDRATGDLWVGDVGQNAFEEIDRVELGGNYGWNTAEGLHCYATMPCQKGGLIDPMVEYDHGEGSSVTGGYVYRGSAIPSLVGTYLYADYGSGNLWGLFSDGVSGQGTPVLLQRTGLDISSFGEGLDGELYLVSLSGNLHKIVASGMTGPSTFPQKLSQTGCVDPANPAEPSAGLIPYDVNVQLWSDGAAKRRWLALPDGEGITINSDGDFEFPVGSVLMKEFSRNGKRLETRLFMRHPDGDWAGYVYEWNAQQSDATLLPAGKTATIDGQSWQFPSRDQCLECHTDAAARVLGPELAQLNKDFEYPGKKIANQLATWDHIALFDSPLPSPAPTLAGSTVEARARGYLHANCSGCHRPNSTGRGPADFRYATALADMGVCNADPSQGNLGVTDAKLLTPGQPAKSIMSLRMHATDVNRMPPLATQVVDGDGVKAVDDWIASLAGCQ
jgi:uncharacterized repeat protein (TIGR03806 family)